MSGRSSSPSRPYNDQNDIIFACQPWLRREVQPLKREARPAKTETGSRLSKSQTDQRRQARPSSSLSGYVGKLCPYCGFAMDGWDRRPTRDHVVPRCEGGTALLIVCNLCNHEKGSMPPDVFLNKRNGCQRTIARLAIIAALRKALSGTVT